METIEAPTKKRRIDLVKQMEISEKIKKDSMPDTYFYIMVVLSCTVATYGLLSNSTAVIIGAMLIAPLMNPILGGGLALITGNNVLLRVTIKAELIGAIIAVTLSAILTLLLPVSELTSEILARTEPTLIDLIIALASGAAGTYAICYRAGATLPGVAIATALMPPLCVVGITLAKQEYHMAGGALLLFIANMVAINVIAIIIFKFSGFTTPSISRYLNLETDHKRFSFFSRLFDNKIIYPIILLIIVSIPLVLFLLGSIESTRKEKIIRNTLVDDLAIMAPNAVISSLKFVENDDSFQINLKLDSAHLLLPDDIRKLENHLEYKLTSPVNISANLSFVQMINNESVTDGYQSVIPKTLPSQEPIIEMQITTPEEMIERIINEKLQLIDGRLEDFSFAYQRGTGTYQIFVVIQSAEPLEESFAETVEKILEKELNRRVSVEIDWIELEE